MILCFFFFQAEDGIRDGHVTGVQTCALPICPLRWGLHLRGEGHPARRDRRCAVAGLDPECAATGRGRHGDPHGGHRWATDHLRPAAQHPDRCSHRRRTTTPSTRTTTTTGKHTRTRTTIDPHHQEGTIMTRLRMRRIRTGSLALGVGLAMALTACGGTTQDSADGEADATNEEDGDDAASAEEYQEGLSISMLPKSVNNPYVEASSVGAEEVVTELGGEYEYTGPSDASASSQVSYINTLSQQAADAIVDRKSVV